MNGPRICTQPCNARRHTCCRAAAPHLRPTRKNASRKRRRDVRDNVANGWSAGDRSIGWWGADGGGSVAFALRCRCLRARSGPADGCRGRDRRCRSRFQRVRGTRRSRHQRFRPASLPPARKSRRRAEGRARRHGRHGWPGRAIRPAAFHRREEPKNEPGGTDTTDETGTTRTSAPRFPTTVGPARPQSELARRLLMWSPRFLSGGVSYECGSRRYPIWSRQFLTSVALIQDMPTPVAGAVVPLTQLQSDLYSFLLGIAGVAPVSDVIALVQDMLSSVAGAVVLLAQLPSDLFSFLLGIAGVQPVVAGVGGVDGPGLSAAAGASVASRLPLGLPLAGISGPPLAGVSGLPVTGEATGVAPLDVIALGRASAVSGMAPVAPDGAFPIGAGSFFRHVFGELLLPVSLWALAAGALPGAGGLVILFATGARLGYRQAKAGFALRAAGIASFARPGAVPLGVVRSAVIGCHPSEGIARRPSGGVKRRTSSR